MKELNMEYHTKYCTCCGMLSAEVWKKLHDEGESVSGMLTWKEHFALEDSDNYNDNNGLKFCGECGKELTFDEIKIAYEFWGASCHEVIVVGYKCSGCGHEDDF